MERNWDLVRKILVKLEGLSTLQSRLDPSDVEGYDKEFVSYHMHLMDQAGLIKAKCTSGSSPSLHCVALSLTWEGHEFLDKVRNDTIWNTVKGIARDKGLDLSFDVIKMAAKSVIELVF